MYEIWGSRKTHCFSSDGYVDGYVDGHIDGDIDGDVKNNRRRHRLTSQNALRAIIFLGPV